MSVLTRSALEASPLADLHTIASELGIDGFRRLRKADLVDKIITQQGGEDALAAEPEANGEVDEKPKRRTRSRTSRTRRKDADTDGEDGVTDEDAGDDVADVMATDVIATEDAVVEEEIEAEEAAADDVDVEAPEAETRPRRRSRGGRGRDRDRDEDGGDRDRGDRDRDRGDRDRDRGDRDRGDRNGDRDAGDREDRIVEGTVELLPNGSGFVRISPPEASDADVYVSAAQVRRCELVSGDRVAGPVRAPRRSERYPSLVRVDTINGASADAVSAGARYEDLPVDYPSERFALESKDPTLGAIEWLTPFGKGSRVVIAGVSRSGKSEALR
ncbi:MAG: transcription termination factor Rho, partial [Baekduia sp.]|nr:transcription termination factor Rho [Baekduia sp.]